MRERALIGAALLALAVTVTMPAWYNHASRASAEAPRVVLPPSGGRCVEPTDTMRRTHMDLLIGWRDEVVRNGRRTYRASDGRVHEMSLTRTCLDCHRNKAEFCDRCHGYASVTPACWGCHIDPSVARPVS